MDFLTLRQAVLADLSNQVSAERVDRAICEAMKYWRSFPATFNRQRITLTCTANQDAYGTGTSAILPQDNGPYDHEAWTVETFPASAVFVAVPNPVLEIRHLRVLDGDRPRELNKVSMYELEDLRSTGRTAAFPTHWSWWDEKLILAPVPTTAAVIQGLAIVDLGTPLAKYITSAWATRTPNDGAALNTLYTNGWLTHGFETLKYQTLAILYANVVQGEVGQIQSQGALQQAQAHYERIRDMEVKRDFPKTLAPYLPGLYI